MSDKTYKDMSDAIKEATSLQNKTGMLYLVGKNDKGSYFVQSARTGKKFRKGGRVY